jgi:hypothetical protein
MRHIFMTIHQLIFSLLVFCLVSCGSKATIKGSTREHRDSMLLKEIATQFDYQHIFTREIAYQLKNLRRRILNDTSFGDYHLNAYLFDDQRYPPFIIEVTTNDSIVVSYFTYTDEIYYLRNGIEAIRDDSSNVFKLKEDRQNNTAYDHKINLERNFNDLVVRLDIKNNLPAIEQLVDIIFSQLLLLESYDDADLEVLLQKVDMTDQLRSVLILSISSFVMII